MWVMRESMCYQEQELNAEPAGDRARSGVMPFRRSPAVILAIIGALAVWGIEPRISARHSLDACSCRFSARVLRAA